MSVFRRPRTALSVFCWRSLQQAPRLTPSSFRTSERSASMFTERCSVSQASKDHLLLVSDLDLTMVDHKDSVDGALLDFNLLWASEYSYNSQLIYSTGRSMQRYSELQKVAPLLTPEVLILSVGTEIRLGPSFEVDIAWAQQLDDGWDRDVIVEECLRISYLRFQEEPDQGSHKVSLKVDRKKGQETQKFLSERLADRGLRVKVLYSSGIDLDILPHKAGKGQALAYLLKNLNQKGILHKNVLVCGDSGNDIDLFSVKGVYGVIVSNAQDELIEWHQLHGSGKNIFRASRRCSGGIMEALEHFKFGCQSFPNENTDQGSFSPKTQNSPHLPGAHHREIVQLSDFILTWMLGKVANTGHAFARLDGVINDKMKAILSNGSELTGKELLEEIRKKHGSMQASGLFIWIDKIDEQQLAAGVHLITWQTWEQSPGEQRRGYSTSAILQQKDETPNGVEWVYFHKTLRSGSDYSSPLF